MCQLKDEDSVQRNTAPLDSNQDEFRQEFLQSQRTFCRRLRFAPDLCTEFFIYSGGAENKRPKKSRWSELRKGEMISPALQKAMRRWT